MSSADDWVATDTNARSESDVAQLVHHLVGQSTGLGNQADLSWVWSSLCWDDAGIGLARRNQTWAVWSNDAGLAALLCSSVEFRGVLYWYTFGDHDDEWHLGINGFFRSSLGELRWHEDDRNVGSGLVLCIFHGAEHWNGLTALEFDLLAGFLWVDTTNDIGTRVEHALGVLHALRAGHALNDDLRI